MNYHSHRQLSTGILLAMGGLLCEVWARKPTFEEGGKRLTLNTTKEGSRELGGGINTLVLSAASLALFYSYERCSLLQPR